MGTDKTWDNKNYYKAANTQRQHPFGMALRVATPAHSHSMTEYMASDATNQTTITTATGQMYSNHSYGVAGDPWYVKDQSTPPLTVADLERLLERHREMLEQSNKTNLEQWVLEHPEARRLLEHALASGAPNAPARDEYNTMVAEMHDLLHLLDQLYESKDHTIPTPAWAAIGAAAKTIRRLRDLPRVTLPRYFQHPWGTMDDVEEGHRMSAQDCQACWYVDLYDGPVPRCLDCGAQAKQCRCGHGAHIGPCACPPAP